MPEQKIREFQEKLMESEQKYRTIFENSAVAITVADENESIALWNKFTEDLFDMNKNDLFMKPVSSFYPPEEWQRMRKENIRQKGMQHHFETRMFKKDGSIIDVDISISVLRTPSGEISGSIGIIRDIGRRRRAEQILLQAKEAAETANRTKGAFLYRLSQEVIKPMSTTLEMINTALQTDLNDQQRKTLTTAKQSADELKIRLDDIYKVFKELKDEKFLKVE